MEYGTYYWAFAAGSARHEVETVDPDDKEELERGHLSVHGVDLPQRGFCELIFEIRERRVYAVKVRGRSVNGLKADASCVLEARRCLPGS